MGFRFGGEKSSAEHLLNGPVGHFPSGTFQKESSINSSQIMFREKWGRNWIGAKVNNNFNNK